MSPESGQGGDLLQVRCLRAVAVCLGYLCQVCGVSLVGVGRASLGVQGY